MNTQTHMHFPKVVSISSGKGGVGKTTIVSNLALHYSKQGKRILIFDGDLGMANVDIFYGVKSKGHLWEVLQKEKTIEEIITNLSPGVDLISGGSGWPELSRINFYERRTLIDSITCLSYKYDYLIMDTAPGLSDSVLYLNAVSPLTGIIINPDPASITDSYALIKVLNKEYKKSHFSIICNQVRDEEEGLILFKKFSDVVSRFLFVGINYLGSIPQDIALRKSNQQQKLIIQVDPLAISTKALVKVAHNLEHLFSLQKKKIDAGSIWNQSISVV